MPSMNSRGFSSQVERGQLPAADHITYEGVFNELTFQAGPVTDKLLDLHIGFCRAGNKQSAVDSRVHEFLALFLKGDSDGKPRDSRRLSSVIVLDFFLVHVRRITGTRRTEPTRTVEGGLLRCSSPSCGPMTPSG